MKNLSAARVIAGDPEDHVWLYSRYNLPWPAEDRDSVIESNILKDYAKGEITVVFKAVEDVRMPPVSGVVRVPIADGTIFLKKLTNTRIFVRYEMKTDPGGLLPEWICNHFTKDVPINTLKALKIQVEKTRGVYNDFIQRHSLLMK